MLGKLLSLADWSDFVELVGSTTNLFAKHSRQNE